MGLHIKADQREGIYKLLQSSNEDIEIEAICLNRPNKEKLNGPFAPMRINYNQFHRLVSYLSDIYMQTAQTQQTLDIRTVNSSDVQNFNNIRLTVTGMEDILSYCRNESGVPFDIMEKTKSGKGYQVDIPQHEVTIKSSIERKILQKDKRQKIINYFKENDKTFRLKKRISFKSKDPENANWRIDCTIVKSTYKGASSLQTINFNNIQPSYEVEIEYIGDNANRRSNFKKLTSSLFGILSEVLKILLDCEYLLPRNEYQTILEQYKNLVFGSDLNLEELSNTKKYFAGPQPISLELRNLSTERIRSHKVIYEKYTVTHKADGERVLIFTNTSGDVYLINNRLVIKKTQLKSQHKQSLFDGEIIISENGDKRSIYIFDCYWFDGQEKYKLKNLIASKDEKGKMAARLDFADEFIRTLNKTNEDVYEVFVKKFLICQNMREFHTVCGTLLTEQNLKKLPFHADGLIFTPLNLSVGCNDESDQPILTGTWSSVLKWKPPEENTIDFLVNIFKQPDGSDCIFNENENEKTKLLELYVGKRFTISTPWEYLHSYHDRKKTGYAATLFKPSESYSNVTDKCYVRTRSNGNIYCQNGDIILDKSIVECSWSIEDKKWVPMRVRQDKTELYKQNGYIGGTANDWNVADSIWFTINNPVTIEHLTGKASVDYIPNKEDKYYVREGTRDKSLNFRMNNFHNLWVKKQHLLRKRFGMTRLVDFGCGKGGDLSKWFEGGYKTVLGIDLFEDNICNPNDGAYARLETFRNRRNLGKDYTIMFIPFNVSKVINKSSIEEIANKETAKIAMHIYGYEKIPDKNMKQFYNIASTPFDVVSCQFAIHYFFENRETLSNFCTNLSNHLKAGGLFVGTCFDGNAIVNLFNKVQNDTVTRKNKDGFMSWSIKKLYNEFVPKETGQKISVYIESINQYLTEYLVDFELLKEELAKFKIRPLNAEELVKYDYKKSSGLFEELFEECVQKVNSGQVKNDDMADWIKMQDYEKELSFLNRWFIFTKDI